MELQKHHIVKVLNNKRLHFMPLSWNLLRADVVSGHFSVVVYTRDGLTVSRPMSIYV